MSTSAPYLISKLLDPVFAITIGVAAAGVRINREEKEKGKTTEQTIASLKRRVDLVWNGETTGGIPVSKGT